MADNDQVMDDNLKYVYDENGNTLYAIPIGLSEEVQKAADDIFNEIGSSFGLAGLIDLKDK